MPQTFEFRGALPERFNLEELTQEIAAVAPQVVIEFSYPITWENFPYTEDNPIWGEDYPEDPSLPWEQPGRIVVSNVPDQYTRQQVATFISNHSASETEEERNERARREKAKVYLLHLIENDQDVISAIQSAAQP